MARSQTYTCPLCEATCGLVVEVHGEGPHTRAVGVRGDAQDVFSHGFVCPKGLAIADLQHDPDRLRRPLVDGGRDHVGRRLAGGRATDCTVRRRARPPAFGGVPRQPDRAQPGRHPVRPGGRQGRGYALRVQRVHERPDAQAGVRRADVRPPADDPHPGRRPHRPARRARRRPADLQRLPDDRARHARPPASPARTRGPAGRGRPAHVPHRPRGGPAPAHPAGHRRVPARRARAAAPARTAPSPGRTSPASTSCRVSSNRSPPRPSSRTPASRRGRSATSRWNWRGRRPPRSTGAWARRRCASARSRPGSWTW